MGKLASFTQCTNLVSRVSLSLSLFELAKEAVLHKKFHIQNHSILSLKSSTPAPDAPTVICQPQAALLKSEAGGVLGEVRRKLSETTKALELLKSLGRLRDIRKQEAERKGAVSCPECMLCNKWWFLVQPMEMLVTVAYSIALPHQLTLTH